MPMWKLGEAVCKLVPTVAGTNVFVSTLSITAIALDRFHLIVHPTDKDPLLIKSCMAMVIVGIWLLAVFLAAPLMVFSITQAVEPVPGLRLYEVCVENADLHVAKTVYSVLSALFQYLAPIVIVSVAHAQICNKLRSRMTSQLPASHGAATRPSTTDPPTAIRVVIDCPTSRNATPHLDRKRRKDALRKRKTNRLLVAIAVVFAGSWLPLNVLNIVADLDYELVLALDRSGLIFAVCHLVVLGSACANPVLYGWLNDNFRREFLAVLCRRCVPGIAGQRQQSPASRADDDRNAVNYSPRESVNRSRFVECPVDTHLCPDVSDRVCTSRSSSPQLEDRSDHSSLDPATLPLPLRQS